MNPGAPSDTHATRLLQLLGGKWLAAAVSTAATLGLPDALAAGPLSMEQLAKALKCDPPSLARLVRVLGGEGLVEEAPDGLIHLTDYGAELRSESLGALAEYVGAPSQWDPWSHLPHAVRTGESAFRAAHGEDLFDYLATRPAEAALYNAAVDAFTRRQARALAVDFDFSRVETVVDVGGGLGTLLVELLSAHPHLNGILYDLPPVISAARARFEAGSAVAGLRYEAGDFLKAVPAGADAYVVKHVVHNWGDHDAIALLARCGEAAGPTGVVLVIDGIVLPGNRRDATKLLDLEMLALCKGGRERSKPEFRALFRRAGLKLESARPLGDTTRLLVGRPR